MPSSFDLQQLDFQPPKALRSSTDIALTSIGDLLNEPTPEQKWVVDDMLLVGGFSLLAGKPKSGKSTLSRSLALAVARGDSFLDRKTMQGPVAAFYLEDHRSMLKESFQKLGSTGEESILIHCGSIPRNPVQQLEALIAQHHPVLVVVDTVFRFARCFDTNSYSAVLESLTPLSDLARKTGVHILGLHHMGKAERSDSADQVLGSVAIHGSVDCTLLLRRTSQYRVIESQQRYGLDLPATTLNFKSDTGQIEAGPLASEIEVQRISSAIVEYLLNKQPLTEAEISDSISGRTEIKRRALRILAESGRVKREGRGGRGDVYRYSVEPEV